MTAGDGPRPTRGIEVQEVLEAERRGTPFLLLREDGGPLVVIEVPPDRPRLTVGRDPSCDIAITSDAGVSRLHAELTPVAGAMTLVDDGLSRNGTFVNGARVTGRRRLGDRDVLRVGRTLLVFRDPSSARPGATTIIGEGPGDVAITPAQRRVLVELCRPMAAGPHVPPASNQEIADRLVLSVAAVKTHIRALFLALDIEDLPQSRKRARLAQVAFQRGLVSDRDLLETGSGEAPTERHAAAGTDR